MSTTTLLFLLKSVSFFMICFKKRYKCRPERNKNKFPICLMMMTAFKSTIGHPSSTYLNVNVFGFSLNSDTQAWFAQDFQRAPPGRNSAEESKSLARVQNFVNPFFLLSLWNLHYQNRVVEKIFVYFELISFFQGSACLIF